MAVRDFLVISILLSVPLLGHSSVLDPSGDGINLTLAITKLAPHVTEWYQQSELFIEKTFGALRNECLIDLQSQREDLLSPNWEQQRWAVTMLDASTKIPSGILKMNVGGWMGEFDECLSIENKNRSIKGNYCLGTWNATLDIEFFNKLNLHGSQFLGKSPTTFQNQYPVAAHPAFGFCVPSGCEAEDLETFFDALNFSMPFKCQTYDQAHPPLSVKAWVVIIIFAIVLFLMAGSTFYDLYMQYYKGTEPSGGTVAFSMYSNGKKLFSMQNNENELSCLNGIRVLSMIWVVAGHTCSVTVSGPVKNTKDVLNFLDSPISMLFASGVHCVDTFLMIGGLLVAYNFAKSKSERYEFNASFIGTFYLNRYLRLTPSYFAAILMSMSLLQYFGSGPHWSFIVDYFQGFCTKSWWTALLYVQNYVNVDSWCLGQTWYLDIDWQVYLLSPLFLIPLMKRPVIGQAILIVALIFFISVAFTITWVYELPALVTDLYRDLSAFNNLYYLKTHTRVSSWFVGALVGHFISKYKFDPQKKEFPKMNTYVLYGVSSAVAAIIPMCVFLGQSTLRSPIYYPWGHAFYNALVRPCWAACIGWIIYVCVSGSGGILNDFLSLPIFQVLNRFTYAIYLLHVTMLYMIVYAAKSPVHFSLFHLLYSFWGIMGLSSVLSIFWVLAFESPVILLQKYLAKTYRTRKEQVGDKTQAGQELSDITNEPATKSDE